MFGQYFYHAVTRRFIAVFGTLFNDLHIQRLREDTTTQDIKVPLTYGSYDKMLARLNEDPNLDRKIAAISPALSFVIGAPKYDATRKLQSTLQRCIKTDAGIKTQYVGVPYNFDVSLYIYAKEEEDGLKILEQILPYFTPSLTVTVVLDDVLDYKMDVPIVLNDIDYENEKNWGSFTDRRYLIWELKFTMKGEFAGPITSDTKPLIKLVTIPFYNLGSGNTVLESIFVQPGLTANGQSADQITETIPRTLINPDDPYGYIIETIPSPITPIAVSDFKNGAYSIYGESKTLSDLWVRDSSSWSAAYNPSIHIVPGVGLTCSNPGDFIGPVAAPELLSVLNITKGVTMLVEFTVSTGTASVDIEITNFPGYTHGSQIWINGTGGGGFGANTWQVSSYDASAEIHGSLTPGSHTIAATIGGSTTYSASIDNSDAISDSGTEDMSGVDNLGIGVNPINVGDVSTISKITFYKPQDPYNLNKLTV